MIWFLGFYSVLLVVALASLAYWLQGERLKWAKKYAETAVALATIEAVVNAPGTFLVKIKDPPFSKEEIQAALTADVPATPASAPADETPLLHPLPDPKTKH